MMLDIQKLYIIRKYFKRFIKDIDPFFLKELFILAIILGVLSGIICIIFYELLNFIMDILFNRVIGFKILDPGKDWGLTNPPERPFLIPLIVMFGGLISGLLVYLLAPETEGHGTDAAIAVFHKYAGKVRARVPIVKLIASSITIGSGGSAGREGPMAQIGSAIGSILASIMKLDTYKRRLATVVGISAGIGTAFKAPLGGAIFGVEVLYKRDFEVEALIPALIASTIGYTIFGLYSGFEHIFNIPYVAFKHPIEIPFYAFLGVLSAIMGIIYINVFYKVRRLFSEIKLPKYSKPMIGGLATGLIGMFFPQVLEMGYGWIPLYARNIFPITYYGDAWLIGREWKMIVITLLFIAFLKILVTAFTISSGGSGGVFAPGLCVGASLGAALGILYINIFPDIIPEEGAFLTSAVVIGMMSFFAGVSKAPIAVLIMISEMTGSYELMAPAMLSIAVSYLLTGNHTIYSEQVLDRAHSSAHLGEYHRIILNELKVKEAMVKRYPIIKIDSDAKSAFSIMVREKIRETYIVDDNGILLGKVSYDDLIRIPSDQLDKIKISKIMNTRLIVAYPEQTLYEALLCIVRNKIEQLPVVKSREERIFIGVISKNDIIKAHDKIIHFLLDEELGLR